MKRLSCKIFGEYYTPPLPVELASVKDVTPQMKWKGVHIQNENQIAKLSALPFDLDPNRNPNRYPAHPQIRHLVHVLRYHGLFR